MVDTHLSGSKIYNSLDFCFLPQPIRCHLFDLTSKFLLWHVTQRLFAVTLPLAPLTDLYHKLHWVFHVLSPPSYLHPDSTFPAASHNVSTSDSPIPRKWSRNASQFRMHSY